jgi:hypothetical protein
MAAVRPSIRRAARTILPFLLLVAAWNVWDNVEQRRFDDASQMFGTDSPVALGREGDAARLYAAAAIASVNLQSSAVPAASPIDVIRRRREAMRNGQPLGPEDTRTWSEFSAQAAAPARLIEEGSHGRFVAFAPGTDFNYRASGLSNAARLAEIGTLSALEQRDSDGTFRSLLARIRVLRAFTDNVFLQGQRARLAQDIATDLAIAMSGALMSVEQLQSLSDALAELLHDDELVRAVNGMARGQMSFVNGVTGRWPGRTSVVGRIMAPWFIHRAVNTLESLGEAQRVAARPWPQRFRDLAAIKDPSPSFGVAEWTSNVALAIGSFEATVRAARGAIAIERFRRQHTTVPRALSDLPIPLDELRDPFSGELLKYSSGPDAFVIYSLGGDGRDDGGRLHPNQVKGRAPGVGPLLDIGVQVNVRKPG